MRNQAPAQFRAKQEDGLDRSEAAITSLQEVLAAGPYDRSSAAAKTSKNRSKIVLNFRRFCAFGRRLQNSTNSV